MCWTPTSQVRASLTMAHACHIRSGLCQDLLALYSDAKQCKQRLEHAGLDPEASWRSALNVFRMVARLHHECTAFEPYLARARAASGGHLGSIALPISDLALSPDCDGAVPVWDNVFQMMFVVSPTEDVGRPWDGFSRKGILIRKLLMAELGALLAEILWVLRHATQNIGWCRAKGDQPYVLDHDHDDDGEANPLEAAAWLYSMATNVGKGVWADLVPVAYKGSRFDTLASFVAHKDATFEHLGIHLI